MLQNKSLTQEKLNLFAFAVSSTDTITIPRRKKMVICHMSPVMCHMSCAICDQSPVTYAKSHRHRPSPF